jgi:hypothetical protein
MNNIFLVRGSERVGPFSESDIRAQLASGALTGDSLVWWEGLPQWTPLARTPLAANAGASSPGNVGANAPAFPPHAGPQNSGLAITSLVLGCIGWLFPLVLGPAGVITGHLARGEIKRNPALKGGGMALAGLILGYIWSSFIILAFISIVAISVLIALGNQVKSVFTTINSQIAAPANPNP